MSNSASTIRGSRGGQWRGPTPGPRPPLSRAQIDSTLARLEGLFGFVFALLSIPVLTASLDTLRPEWAWGVPAALFGSFGVAFICSLAGRGVRVSMAVVACVFVLTLVLWPLAVRSPEAAIGTQPWLWYIVIVAIGAAGISFSTFWASVYTVAVPTIFAVLRVLPAGGGAPWELALLEAVYAFLLGCFVVVVITALRTSASQVDDAQSTAVRRYADAAKQHAAEQERTRVDTVIHDRVLSTLLAASRARTADERDRAVQMARRALVALQSADAESEGSADLPLSVLVDRSRVLAETLTADIGFSVDGALDGVVPARVIEGLYSATVQAIVNSIQHADPGPAPRDGSAAGRGTDERGADGAIAAPVERTISVHGRGGGGVTEGVTVVVADTGAGFDLDAVPPDRLGLRISIRERVDAVGGLVEIRSVPGAGTSVVLTWPAPRLIPDPDADAGTDADVPDPAGAVGVADATPVEIDSDPGGAEGETGPNSADAGPEATTGESGTRA